MLSTKKEVNIKRMKTVSLSLMYFLKHVYGKKTFIRVIPGWYILTIRCWLKTRLYCQQQTTEVLETLTRGKWSLTFP